MPRPIRKSISLFLLAIFSIASTPDHLIHAFAGHEDTVDCNHTTPEVSLPHIHCAALQFSLPAFSEAARFFVPSFTTFLGQLFFETYSPVVYQNWFNPSGRAPPFLA